MRASIRFLAAGIGVIVLAGCTTPEALPPSGPHPPVGGAQVRLYQKQPKRYEELAVISVSISPDMKMDDRGGADAAFDTMKAQAGALGANGLLLMVRPEKHDYTSTAGYHGDFYQVPMRRNPKAAVGLAVFVLEE